MARRPVAAICWENAAGQREFPDAILLAQRRRQRRITPWDFAERVLVQVFPPCGGTLLGGNLGPSVVLGAFLHESDERSGPVRRVQCDETQSPLANARHEA